MKFPETKTRSPLYKMLSPLVEKAPLVPFISSFLRCRPGPVCVCRWACREHSQGQERLGPAAVCCQSPAIRSPGHRADGRGSQCGLPPHKWTLFPQEAWAAWRQLFKEGFPISSVYPPGQDCWLSCPYLFSCSFSASVAGLSSRGPQPKCYVLPVSGWALLRKPPLASLQTARGGFT